MIRVLANPGVRSGDENRYTCSLSNLNFLLVNASSSSGVGNSRPDVYALRLESTPLTSEAPVSTLH